MFIDFFLRLCYNRFYVPARWLARRPFLHIKKAPGSIDAFFERLPSPNLFSDSSSYSFALRALSLLISSPTILQRCPTLGYTAEGVPLGLTAHSLRVLHLNWRGFTAHRPCCLERVNTPWVWWVFLPFDDLIVTHFDQFVKGFFKFFCRHLTSLRALPSSDPRMLPPHLYPAK